MDRIERNGGGAGRCSYSPETVFIFDISGAVQEVVCDRSDRAATPRRPAPEAELPPKVIRQWLAGVAIALLGLGVSAEPGTDREPPATSTVVKA